MGRSKSGTDAFAGGGAEEQPEHLVDVATFRLDEFEVTVGRFRRFFDAYDGTPPSEGAGAHPDIDNSGWQSAWNSNLLKNKADLDQALVGCSNLATWTVKPGAGDSAARPLVCLTWYEAFAFCAWDGGRLPTEAEWEYAAAGGPQNRVYPWGDMTPDTMNSLAVFECSAGGTLSQCTSADLPSVGSCPDGESRYGQRDLAGSVYEMTLDLWDPEYYANFSTSAPASNVANVVITNGDGRVMRGGSFISPPANLRATFRTEVLPGARNQAFGVRCARSE